MTENEVQKSMIAAREKYIDIIKSELLGPGSEFSLPDKEHELLSTSPTSRYSVGILFPQGNLSQEAEDKLIEQNNTLENDNGSSNPIAKVNHHICETDEMANENLDEEINMSTQYMPSSMGITFLAKGDTSIVKGRLEFATYRKSKIADCYIPYIPDNPDTYQVPPQFSHIMSYDNQHHVMKLLVSVNVKEIHNLFNQNNIPEVEFRKLQKIAYRFVDYCSKGYIRVPHIIPEFVVNFFDDDYSNTSYNENLDGTTAKIVALRRKLSDNIWSITIMLVNALEESPIKADHCIFQSQIAISTNKNSFCIIESNPNTDVTTMDDEEQSLDLLYRDKKIYGTGLGTSVDWKINSEGFGEIWTDFFPMKEIPSINFSLPKNDILSNQELSMKYLSDLDQTTKDKKLKSMRNLVALYKNWVKNLEKKATESLESKYISAANKNIQECKKSYERMYSGIKTLEKNENAYKAFLLANRAMFMQRVHITIQAKMSKINADRYPGDSEISDTLLSMDYYTIDDLNCRWRPFQIAFLLMDINSIVFDTLPERNIVDLIWFPTGGGKTEAYLGLTAFTIFYRRLAHPKESGGTSVIMRYTLRLLAAQQFTRAATLICACEYIRQDCTQRRHKYPAYLLGKTPITIGLWIGGAHIPNKNNEASEHLNKLFNVSSHYYVRNEKERHNKFQVLKCPWCGTKMVKDDKNGRLVGEWGYSMSEGKHFYMYCPHEDCDFTKKLPIQIIDEELYQKPPTLLFGTVDKFAMLPWDGRIGSFFGISSNNRSPELIIQDELHLISGALGTIVGLYETAVDSICEQKGISPKIIASTATIRRSKEQCSVLYNRNVTQFPASGLDASDSFFARESVINHKKGIYGRKYVGIMPSGKTKVMTEIRTIAALLQKAETMNEPDAVKDKFWTLTVYFNSLKDLGKTSTLIDDDVKDFIIRIANRTFTNRRLITGVDELTSRVSTTELNETLDKLEKIEYSKENRDSKRYASNVLLATNMISVGIDVARLNVMLMIGQPKLTNEYIQASSRVGRSYPGVTFIQYDASKSRDRSHYERFIPYHDSFYRFVEPTSATPFSQPARERGLHAVLISILRQKAGFFDDKDAMRFDLEYFKDKIDQIEKFILKRVEDINTRSKGKSRDNLKDIQSEMEDFFSTWQAYVDECNNENPPGTLYFGKKFMSTPPSSGQHRLIKQYNSAGNDTAIETLTSMRNVDTPVNGSIIVWEDK